MSAKHAERRSVGDCAAATSLKRKTGVLAPGGCPQRIYVIDR
jgi:hypothetical protein